VEYALPLATIWLANILATMSPGPGFVVVARTAAERSRRAGIASAMGMTLGAVVWAMAAMFGLALLLTQVTWLYRAVQILGALYLVYLAVAIWRSAPKPFATDGGEAAAGTPWRAFMLGAAVQLSNPKVAVFFGSIYVALLPAHAPAWFWAAALVMVLVNESAWYSAVALAFSAPRARRAYGRAKLWLDRAMAGFLGALGAKLLFDNR
jgi:threonine/homoserine/homoserine lactone efflux protein